MTIIEKIKQSVEGATGMPFLYHAAGELNELIARCKELPVAYSFLIDSGTIDDVNGRYHERVTLAVMFCDKTEFDFNALENEQIIDRMKVKAYKWLQSLRMSNALRVVSVNNTQRLYDNTTDVLTGFAVNITIEDVAGVGECELPQVVIDVDKNGSYDVVGVDKVRVNVLLLPKLEDLEVTQNGEYLPPTDIDGFRKVNVDVQTVLETLEITANGTYTPQEGVDGFSKVVANVVPTKKVVLPSRTQISNTQIIDGYWAGELVDTSMMTDMYRMFRYCSLLQNIDVSSWDVSNVTNMNGVFEGCTQLQSLDVSNWDVGGVTTMNSMFFNCPLLQTLDVSNWDVSNVTTMDSMFRWCSQLQTLDVSNWDVSNVTDMDNIFYDTQLQNLDVSKWDVSGVTTMQSAFRATKIQTLDVSNWDVGGVTTMNSMFRWCSQLQTLDVSNWDVSNVTDMDNMFSECSQLQTLIGNRTIDDVLANNISALNGLKVALLLSYTILDRASLRALINGLADLTGQTTQTLTLGPKLRAKLTEEDIAITTSKNWTIV